MGHEMWMLGLGGGWYLMAMAQAYPVVTTGAPFQDDHALHRTDFHLTQPAAMINVGSPGSRLVLRTTLNFEGITQSDGILTPGGWGEGFIDARHPHTLLHEAMLSLNFWDVDLGAAGSAAFSISAGKGFAPFGTDDPMARPVLKYPTNHHLSQILERWTVNGVFLLRKWGVEAGVFGGSEPTGPYDFSNIESFGDSWSARLSRRFGPGFGPMAAWETSISYARVAGHAEDEVTELYNAAIRHDKAYGFGGVYALVEASMSRSDGHDDFWALLGEAQLEFGRHRPYYRIEYATRPEYERLGPAGSDAFFRYDHDAHPIGATRWLINSAGYGFELSGYPFSARIFAEVQHHFVWEHRGGVRLEALFGDDNFLAASFGFRLFFGGGPMRMGSYGVLDPMSVMHRR
jgi:hypothetical protein